MTGHGLNLYNPRFMKRKYKVVLAYDGTGYSGIMEKVLGAPLPREVNMLVDRNAGARGVKCYCTSATYVVGLDELTAA